MAAYRPRAHLVQRRQPYRTVSIERWLTPFAVTILGLLSAMDGVGAAPPPDPQRWVSGEVLVHPRAGAPAPAVERALGAHGGRALGKLRGLSVLKVQVPLQAELAVARALARHPAIEFAEVNAIVEPELLPNDPRYATQWHLPKIGGPTAWDTTRGEGIVVAILDTGVEATHPDLATQLVGGWNTVLNNGNTTPVHPHGTMVAGTAAAAGNDALGVASVAWRAQIMPIKVTEFADGSASLSEIAEGIIWAADHGADVANASYAGVAGSPTIATAAAYMQDRGGIVVVAAGNSGTELLYADSPYSIVVSATTSSDAKASWSSYGAFVDVAAPGAGIPTTTTGGGYASVSGTSFASPVTAGIVALIMATNPNLTPDVVEQVLESTALDLGAAGWDPLYGHGRVDAARAVLAALDLVAPDAEAPTVAIDSPTSGSVNELVPVDITATDNVGVEYVELVADGVLIGRDEVAPYAFAWDSTTFADGLATLTAFAVDAAGNVGRSELVNVTIDNTPDPIDSTLPSVVLITPADGSTVSKTIEVRVAASDDGGLARIDLFIHGAPTPVATANTSPLIYRWNTRRVSRGIHTLRAEATDLAGNTQTTAISVTVK